LLSGRGGDPVLGLARAARGAARPAARRARARQRLRRVGLRRRLRARARAARRPDRAAPGAVTRPQDAVVAIAPSAGHRAGAGLRAAVPGSAWGPQGVAPSRRRGARTAPLRNADLGPTDRFALQRLEGPIHLSQAG